MREKIAAGNWKMFKNYDEAVETIAQLNKCEIPVDVNCIVAPPYIYLKTFEELTQGNSRLNISAQNCHFEESGAYTGEISVPMLRSINIPYVIIGHSERREQHQESNEELMKKVYSALKHDLKPIFCCGEPLEIRKSGEHIAYVTTQLTESLSTLSKEEMKGLILAYEPIWAIGTGETASPEQAQEMHAAIRAHLSKLFDNEVAAIVPILYGGSVKPGNAKEIFAKEDVDGGLVGGAALDAESFDAIIHSF